MNISSINKTVGKGLNWVAERPYMTKQFDKAITDPAKFAAGMLVTSIITKDVVSGYLYTTQSLHNEKIPKEKRKFIAALDAVNCVLMVGGQFLIGKLIERSFTPKFFAKQFSGSVKDVDTKIETPLVGHEADKASLAPNNLIGSVKDVFSPQEDKDVSKNVRKIRQMLKEKGIDWQKVQSLGDAERQAHIDDISKALIKKIGPGSTKFKAIETGFAILVGALATTALTKRTIVPLVATPIAGWGKEKFMDDKKTQIVMTPAMANSTMPKTTLNKISG